MDFLGQIFLLFLTIGSVYFANAQTEYFRTDEACVNGPFVFNSKTGNFTSPGPGGYPDNTQCQWDIKLSSSSVIEVTFHDFNLEESKTCLPYDYVQLTEHCDGKWRAFENASDSGAYCGNQTKFTLRSRCGHVRVEFKSDDSDNGLGFNATFLAYIDKASPSIECLGANNTCNKMYSEIETKPFTLTCQVSGHPQPEIFWTKQATPQSPWRPLDTRTDRIVDLHNGTLIFKDLTMNDTGTYECFANNSLGEDDKTVSLHVEKKCICPKYIRTNWYSVPPYTNENHLGLFHSLLEEIVQTCCGNCTGGHGPSEILYQEGGMKKSLMEVKNNVHAADTISFPIAGKKSDREFQSRYDFMPLVSSPGVAFFVVEEEPGTSARAVFDSVLSGWPILLLTLLMALLSGMVMWALDTKYNPDEFPRSFIKGTGEGFWWAFVTMTTVGYGDRSPRGFLARIFAIVWVLVGLVITSIFTGVVTTSLTAITLSNDVKLYGTSIGAITNSTEYRLGLNKNAKITGVENFETLIKQLKEREFKGALIDTYVAGEFLELQDDSVRINKIIDYDSHYGIVFGGQGPLAEHVFKKCVEEHVLLHKAQIFKQVEEKTSPVKKKSESAAVEKSSGLFDSTSPLFRNAVYWTLGMLLLFTACGILWDYGYMRHWRKKTELEELELLGGPAYEMAQQNLQVMDSLMEEVQEFYDSWTNRLDEMSARHDAEQKQVSRYQR